MDGLFQHSSGHLLRFIIFSVLSVILTVVDYRNNTLSGFRSSLSTVLVHPLQVVADLPANVYDWTDSALTSRHTLQDENERLKAESLLLKSEQLLFAGLQAENMRLRELLNASEKVGNNVFVAEVITVDLDPYRQQLQLNKGHYHGISQAQPIIDAYGVMGQIEHTSALTSTALLISDPSHAIPVQINRNGLRTIAQGLGNSEELELLHIPSNADVEIGDLVLTSGLGGRFPPNYPVGKISRISREPGQAFLSAYATPMARLHRSREVLIVSFNNEIENP